MVYTTPDWLLFEPVASEHYERLSDTIPAAKAVRSYAEGFMIAKLYPSMIVVFDKDGVGRAFYQFYMNMDKTFDDLIVEFTRFPLSVYAALALTCSSMYPELMTDWQVYAGGYQNWNRCLTEIDLETV